MSTFKDARTFLLESYLDGVIDDDEFILLCRMKPSWRSRNFHMNFFFVFTWNNDIKIQEYRKHTLNSCSATSTLLMPVSIPPVFFSFFNLLLSSLASREGCSDLELPFCQLWNEQLHFGSSFQWPLPFLSSRKRPLFCSSEGVSSNFLC